MASFKPEGVLMRFSCCHWEQSIWNGFVDQGMQCMPVLVSPGSVGLRTFSNLDSMWPHLGLLYQEHEYLVQLRHQGSTFPSSLHGLFFPTLWCSNEGGILQPWTDPTVTTECSCLLQNQAHKPVQPNIYEILAFYCCQQLLIIIATIYYLQMGFAVIK